MAKFFGKNSAFLKYKVYEYILAAIFIFLVPILIIWVAMQIFSPQFVVALALVLLLLCLRFLQPLTLFFNSQSHKFSKGRGGELAIKKLLKDFPDSYSVFQGVVISKNKGDIDFVLVGPKGVISLEVKSLGGNITYQENQLLINEKVIYGKNFLEQAFGEARALGNFFRDHLDLDIYVKPVLLFSHDHAKADFGDSLIDNIYIADKQSLFNLIHSFPDYQYQEGEKEKVEAVLKSLV